MRTTQLHNQRDEIKENALADQRNEEQIQRKRKRTTQLINQRKN
jgi:hypothetical protein